MTKSQTLQKVTDDYLGTAGIITVFDIDRIQEELQSKVNEAFDEHNVICAKDEKWKKPDNLLPGQVADILMRVCSIKSICCSFTADPDYDLCGIYVSDDLVQWINSKGFRVMSTNSIGIYDISDRTFELVIRSVNYCASSWDIEETMRVIKATAPRVQRCLDSNLVAVGNGVFNYKTKELEPFSEGRIFLTKCPISYNPLAANINIFNPDDNTNWDVESWINELSEDPEVVKLLWEIVGAVIRPLNRWNKCAFFISEQNGTQNGNNGKGTLCELMRCICGEGYYTSIPLSEFSKDFALEPLTKASAIIVDENDVGSYVEKAGNLKAVITNDVIQINRKFKTPIAYQWYGFMIQCLNEYPRFKDKSDSIYRRQLFVPFTKCFTGIEREYIKKDYIHRTEVLEYVLKKVLESNYYRLSEPKSCMKALSEYKETNDPIRTFWAEIGPEIQFNLASWDYLHELYKAWYSRNATGSVVGKTTFIKDLKNVIRENTDWIFVDRTYKPETKWFDKPDPLILKYNLSAPWRNYRGRTPEEMCIPNLDELPTSLRGIIRCVA